MALSKKELDERIESLHKALEEMGGTEKDKIAVLGAMFVQSIPQSYPNRSMDPLPYNAMYSVQQFLLMDTYHQI